MTPIKTWVQQEEKKNVSDHLRQCPYNVQSRHELWKERDEKWDSVLHDLTVSLKQKQIESMWSETLDI